MPFPYPLTALSIKMWLTKSAARGRSDMPDIDWNYVWGPEIKHWHQPGREGHFGDQWGSPEREAHLKLVKDSFIIPYVNSEHTALEIGSGGGRWTQYMLDFRHLYCVELNVESFQYLFNRFGPRPNMSFCKTNGTDFPGIPPASIDFVFTFDVFVHLEAAYIEAYLRNLLPLLKPSANVIIHYADQTKPGVKTIVGFAATTGELLRSLVAECGYTLVQEDRKSVWHSNLMHLRPNIVVDSRPQRVPNSLCTELAHQALLLADRT